MLKGYICNLADNEARQHERKAATRTDNKRDPQTFTLGHDDWIYFPLKQLKKHTKYTKLCFLKTLNIKE